MTRGNESAVVIGAGVSGLTTALCLAEAGRPVRIWAAEPPARTTSAAAGAMWGPSFQQPIAQTMAATAQSLRDFRELARQQDTGVRMAPALTVGQLPPVEQMPPQVTVIPELRPADPDGLPAGWRTGFRATMPVVDMTVYLDYLVSRLSAVGVAIETRTVRSLAEAAAEASVVVNCAGLGARDLADDPSVRPVFGQHVVVTNPGLDELFMQLTDETEWTSFLPHAGRVLCGGISVPDRWDSTPDPAVSERILRRCRRVEPRLADTEVIEVRCGLRPDRPAVRVEVEPLGAARCVHNYGHGGSGVSLSWGCARQAARLITG